MIARRTPLLTSLLTLWLVVMLRMAPLDGFRSATSLCRTKHTKSAMPLAAVKHQSSSNRGIESTKSSTENKNDTQLSFMPNLSQLLPNNNSSNNNNKEPQPRTSSSSSSTRLRENNDNDDDDGLDPQEILKIVASVVVTVSAFAVYEFVGVEHLRQGALHLVTNPQETLQDVIEYVQDAGPAGPLIYGLVYLVAEILAVPATPLTLSAGYLFGFRTGVTVVLLAATAAACIAFLIGKTILRQWVEEVVADNPELRKLDKAIGQEGFKLLLLVRLSPIFPFALSNYVYGASSIDFVPYFWGTLLGFAPGTCGYVYTGMVGQALTTGEGTQPWYVYGAGFVLLGAFLKLITDVAGGIVNAMEDEEDGDTSTSQ